MPVLAMCRLTFPLALVSLSPSREQCSGFPDPDTIDWSIVCKGLPDRLPKQCRERFMFVLSPAIVAGAFLPEEDRQLMLLVAAIGACRNQ